MLAFRQCQQVQAQMLCTHEQLYDYVPLAVASTIHQPRCAAVHQPYSIPGTVILPGTEQIWRLVVPIRFLPSLLRP